MKDKKLLYIATIMVCLTAILGISYAWFSTIIDGNNDSKKQFVQTGDLRLNYIDNTEMSLTNAVPGDNYEKTVSVKNTGTLPVSYNLIWQELTNNIINDELIIEGTCTRFNSSGVEEGTCEDIGTIVVSSLMIKSNISIEAGYTHEYNLKVTFKDTGGVQNYNKNKTFTGRIGIEDYVVNQFREDSWNTIIQNVKSGNIDKYKVGDKKEINLGTYGFHILRIANKSSSNECSNEGFSQSACGFVLEFDAIILRHAINTTNTNVGGWRDSEIRTYLNENLYNEFPTELKNAILDTTIVSGYGKDDSYNFITQDKLYLLSPTEIYSDWSSYDKAQYDTAKDLTRQLDYYKEKSVSTKNYSSAIKKLGTTESTWWLRSAYSATNSTFYFIYGHGVANDNYANISYGISPAFRIG